MNGKKLLLVCAPALLFGCASNPAYKLTQVVPEPVAAAAPFEYEFKYDRAKNGWALVESAPFYLSGQHKKEFIPEVVEFLKPGEPRVNGEAMKQRAKELNAHFGQHDAEYLLEHQELILKEWRGRHYLVFPGTVWQDSAGHRIIPCLDWRGDKWGMDFRWLGGDWDDNGRLVRHGKRRL